MKHIQAIVLAFITVFVIVPSLYSMKKYIQAREKNIETNKFDQISNVLLYHNVK